MNARFHALSDKELLAQCDLLTARASGPGGRRRDTTETAVRIVHRPTGIHAVAAERRSQAENRAVAIKRLRRKLAVLVRQNVAGDPSLTSAVTLALFAASERNPARLDAIALALDALESFGGRISDAARWLGVSTGQLSSFLETDPEMWQEACRIRARYGLSPLRRK
jgi:hypothetical protein